MKFKLTLPFLAAFVVCGLFSIAPKVWADEAHTLNNTDSQFVKQAASDGMAEVKLAELGVQKATRADVKEFAQMMIRDHGAANNELSGLAKSKGVDVSAVIAPKAAEAFQDLEKQGGNDFDKAFLKQMQKDHKKVVDEFESEAKDVKDGALKTFIDKTLPTLKAHLNEVNDLLNK